MFNFSYHQGSPGQALGLRRTLLALISMSSTARALAGALCSVPRPGRETEAMLIVFRTHAFLPLYSHPRAILQFRVVCADYSDLCPSLHFWESTPAGPTTGALETRKHELPSPLLLEDLA